jgi:hypothetical protein
MEYKMSDKKETKRTIHQKIFDMQASMKNVLQGEQKAGMNYKPVPHWEVTEVVKESAMQHGLLILPYIKSSSHEGNDTWVTVAIQITDIDTGEQIVIGDYVGQGRDTQDKGAGKATSYAIKTAYLKIFLLNVTDDTESEEEQDITVKLLEDQLKKYNIDDPIECKAFLNLNAVDISRFREELSQTKSAKRTDAMNAMSSKLGLITAKSKLITDGSANV